MPIFEGFGEIWSGKSLSFGLKKLGPEKSLGFGKFGLEEEKIQITNNSARNEVLNLGLGSWDQSPEMPPNKSQISSLWQDAKLGPIYP